MSANSSASGIEDAVAYRIHRTNRLLLTHLKRFLDTNDTGLTPEKYFIVMKLHENGRLPQSDLVEVALDDGPNVSRLVERLVVAGLIERTQDPADRRARLLELTEAGTGLASRITASIQDERVAVFGGIPDEDLAMFTSVLERLNSNVMPVLTV